MRLRHAMLDLQDAPVTLLLLGGVAVLAVLAASSAGYPVTAWGPGGLVLLALLLAAALLLPHQLQAVPRATLLAGGLLLAYVLWSYTSILWAGDQGAAWTGANRTLVFLIAFALFGLWPQRGRTGAAALTAWVLAIAGIAVVEAIRVHGTGDASLFVDGRLDAPAGYPNANAALFMMAFWPAAILSGSREVSAALRGLFAGAAVVLAGVALLSQSRGSILALPVMLLLALLVAPRPARTLLALVPVAIAAGVAVPFVLDVRDKVVAGPKRWHDGYLSTAPRAIAVCAVVCAVAVALFAAWERRRAGAPVTRPAGGPPRWRAAVGVVLAAVVLFAVINPGGARDHAWHSFKKGQPTAGTPGRLGTGLGSNRYDFYRVALDVFADHPLAGAGVDNFAADYLARGRSNESPRYPHSLELRTLAETGLIGVLLLLGALGVALVAGTRAAWRAPPLRGVVAGAAVLGASYWVVHGSLDWFFEFGGLGAAAFALLGLACACGDVPELWHRARAPLHRLVTVVPGVLAALLVGVVLALPWLSERDVVAAARDWPRDPGRAYARLDQAADLDPLADRPYLVEGSIAGRRGELDRARRAFLAALGRVPRGSYANLQLGAVAAERGDRAEALRRLRRARALAPRDPVIAAALRRVRTGHELTVALVNAALLGRADTTP
jgi:tetratricopeptide (TPR) repeat protein